MESIPKEEVRREEVEERISHSLPLLLLLPGWLSKVGKRMQRHKTARKWRKGEREEEGGKGRGEGKREEEGKWGEEEGKGKRAREGSKIPLQIWQRFLIKYQKIPLLQFGRGKQ